MSEWKDIKIDGMPSNGGSYIVFSNYGIRSAEFIDWCGPYRFQDHLTQNDEGMEDSEGNIYTPTHWMPLPPPPKEPA